MTSHERPAAFVRALLRRWRRLEALSWGDRTVLLEAALGLLTFHAVVSYLPYACWRRVFRALGWEARRLPLLARLAAAVPVHRLTFPSGLVHGHDVARAVADLAAEALPISP